MYANKNYKTDGKVYYMPNKIFDENFSPHEFMIYCFLVSVGDSKGISFWSVPKKESTICNQPCKWHPFFLIIHSVKLSFNRRFPSAYSVRKSPSSRS